MNKKLAKIRDASLQIQKRHILMFSIGVDYECSMSQNVGGLVLDEWCETKEARIGTAYGCEMIRRLLLCLSVDDFSEMRGKHVWVYGEGEGFSFKPKGIGPLKVDSKEEPVMFDDIYKEFGGNIDE